MRDAEKGVGVPDARFLGTANEDEIADLVGQLERYAERKTGRGADDGKAERHALGDTNAANRPRPNRRTPFFSGKKRSGLRGTPSGPPPRPTRANRWGARNRRVRETEKHVRAGRRRRGDGSREREPGRRMTKTRWWGWDAGSSQYASSVQDSDARSVYSVRDSEFGLPDAPADGIRQRTTFGHRRRSENPREAPRGCWRRRCVRSRARPGRGVRWSSWTRTGCRRRGRRGRGWA